MPIDINQLILLIGIDWSIGFPMINCHRFNTPGCLNYQVPADQWTTTFYSGEFLRQTKNILEAETNIHRPIFSNHKN